MTTKIKPPIPKEIDIQNAILAWLSWQKGCMAWRNKSTGVYDSTKKIFLKDRSPFVIKGVPDILIQMTVEEIPVLVTMEVKRPKLGVQSHDQKIFQERQESGNGFYYLVTSVEEAERALSDARSKVFKRIEKIK